jgi:hypothetical protein
MVNTVSSRLGSRELCRAFPIIFDNVLKLRRAPCGFAPIFLPRTRRQAGPVSRPSELGDRQVGRELGMRYIRDCAREIHGRVRIGRRDDPADRSRLLVL